MTSKPSPFTISIPQSKLDDISNRVNSYPWDTISSFTTSWEYGPPPQDLRKICEHWITNYSWRKTEATINSLPQFTAKVQDLAIHFVHERGSGANPRPLLLIHGWPYSFHSYTHLIPRLAHPEHYGGKEEDAFSVVVPSLPGFGFSKKPKDIMDPPTMGKIFNELMTSVLGYPQYIAHGGDWGSYICELMGFMYPESCVGIYITMSSVRHHGGAPRSRMYVADASDEEIAFAKKENELWTDEKAYNLLQSTRPLKLAYAMHDSPVGVLAYILEAFHAWADLRDKHILEVFDVDRLLDEVMLYLNTDSFGTATWIYTADHKTGTWMLPEGERINVPVGVLDSPDPVFPMPPREVLEKSRDVVQWKTIERGGHFPFYEAEDVLVGELLKFGKATRKV